MKTQRISLLCLILVIAPLCQGAGLLKVSWRYYRPGNTGIQGDYNASMWIGPDGNPWIGGYDPIAEEGGVAKFLVGLNRWVNVSNVDYAVIGSANDVGVTRIGDMVADRQGNLWFGTMRGALRMNLAAGPKSLARFDAANSGLPGGLTRDVALAPDGTVWISAESTIWAGGGLTRYNPSTNVWTHHEARGGGKIAPQPKPGGGYFIWTAVGGYDGMQRWDSTTQIWTTFAFGEGQPATLVSLDSTDDVGNVWMMRWYGAQGQQKLDCLRPNGTWVQPSLPPPHPQVPVAALRAFGKFQALMVDGYGELYRFDGVGWTDLGPVPHNGFIDDLDIDAAGNIWLCGTGTGGVIRRDAGTGFWQRYRVTNTSQFDLFNNDLAIDRVTGNVYACANASSGAGGMVKYDGVRWTGFVNDLHYGLGGPWPFPGAPQSGAVYVRPSNGKVVVNPINSFTHEFDGSNWTSIPGGPDQIRQYVEDSQGRLWAIGHYGGLGFFQSGTFTDLGFVWPQYLQRDPDRAGTIWAAGGFEVVRTDGVYNFARSMDDFPDLAGAGASFTGLAADRNGVAWVGTWAPNTTGGSALIRLDAKTGIDRVIRRDGQWPFPGDHVRPRVVTPDGLVWMTYDSEFPSTSLGLCWFDGTRVGVFAAPPEGAWRRGGLPHGNIADIEVKMIPGGYELWMSCLSRGIAVMTVRRPVSGGPPIFAGSGS